MIDKNLNYMINLLDDPDEIVYSKVGENLVSQGADMIPVLESYWESSVNELTQIRIAELINRIRFNSIKDDFGKWLHSPERDIIKGACLVARYQSPDIKVEIIQQKIETIKHDVWLELNTNLTALEKVKILNHIIYGVNNLTPNNIEIWSPNNFLIDRVLDTGKGGAIILGIIYSVIATKLDIPVYGVSLPKSFLLAYVDPLYMPDNSAVDLNSPVLFYINPFDKGNVLGKKEIEHFLEQLKIAPEESYFNPADNSVIIALLIKELIEANRKADLLENYSELELLLEMIDNLPLYS